MAYQAALHRGGCQCGAVRYRITEMPLRSGICHCQTCRKVASASSLPFVVFPSRTFAFETGQAKELISSPGIVRSFCGSCGSPLTYFDKAASEFIDIMTVSLDTPAAYPPTYRVWTSQKVEWDVINDALQTYEEAAK